MLAMLKLLRPAHWVKNILVLLPLMFSGRLLDANAVILGVYGFLAFSCAASAVYVLNDIRDVEKDRIHPVKRKRPIASGAVSLQRAWVLLVVMVALAIVFSVLVGSLIAALILVVYVLMNVAYSFGLKTIPIVDVTILAAGYLLRVLYGGVACGIEVSGWLYLTILCASFYMGLGKRRGEMGASEQNATRKVLEKYTYGFLDRNMYMFLGLANAFYALWARDMGSSMLVTVPLVMILSMKYSLDVEGASDGDPIAVVLSDKWLVLFGVMYLVVVAAILYI